MPVCAACGEDNPERAKFCLNCATSLAAPVRRAEERKVVSVLFCDLVGFTARSEAADPEDVRAVLAPYHDVGMTAIKVAAFGRAVNVTLGLPFPRTSPDHGTALDIAGKAKADASSMRAAIELAAKLALRRKLLP